ncbi:MAG: hypothetical protein ACRDE7_07410 [Sphingobacterium sp.]
MKKVILFVGVFALVGLLSCGGNNTKNESDMAEPTDEFNDTYDTDTPDGVTDSLDTAGNIPTGVPPMN